MFARLVVFCAVAVVVALAIPSVAPQLLAYLDPQENPAPGGAAATAVASIAIPADANGHYRANAVIEGRTIPVFIDTGATTVALSVAAARRLGIQPAPAAFTATVETANGTVRAAPVTLSSIRLGNVIVRDVSAVVLEGGGLELNLLGMSFLNRLTKFEAGGGQLVLVQ
jgi:aspartyl protease family protein